MYAEAVETAVDLGLQPNLQNAAVMSTEGTTAGAKAASTLDVSTVIEVTLDVIRAAVYRLYRLLLQKPRSGIIFRIPFLSIYIR
jgi:hypothetical protein